MHTDPAQPAQTVETGVGQLMGAAQVCDVVVEIGGMPIVVRTDNPEFLQILGNRYGGFVNPAAEPVFELEVEISPPGTIHGAIDPDQDLSVRLEGGRWVLERGDFHAELDPGIPVRRGLGGWQNDYFAPRSSGCHPAHGRNLLSPPRRRRVCCLRHSLCGRTRAAGGERARATRCAVSARPRSGEPNRTGRRRGCNACLARERPLFCTRF